MPEYSTTGCSAASASWPRAQWYANSAPLDSTAAVSSAAACKWPVWYYDCDRDDRIACPLTCFRALSKGCACV